MGQHQFVKNHQGEPLNKSDLPPANTERWTARKKADVVLAVQGGLLSLQEVECKYKITTDEFVRWKTRYDEFGLEGLKVSKRHSRRKQR